jgi:hypothetical protein
MALIAWALARDGMPTKDLTMKVYADLMMKGASDALATAVTSIERTLSAGWERSHELESRARIGEARCFVAPAMNSHPAGALWLAFRPDLGDWYVANIVPMEVGSLTADQYNSILREFHDSIVKPATAMLPVKVTLGAFERAPTDYMSDAATERLRLFSIQANKNTGSGHPDDQRRWFQFILQVDRDGRGPDAATLTDLLREHFDWPAERASELASEYEFGRALLREARQD